MALWKKCRSPILVPAAAFSSPLRIDETCMNFGFVGEFCGEFIRCFFFSGLFDGDFVGVNRSRMRFVSVPFFV